jgi:glycosyltransferase involved in cell wall biosynthesis
MIANSEWTKNLILKHNYSKSNKIHIIPLGSDFEKITKSDRTKTDFFSKYNLPENAKIIVYTAASFKPEKGHIYLLEAMKRIIAEDSNIFLFLLGQGIYASAYFEYMKVFAQKNNIDKNIIFTGVLEKICDVLNFADLFVSPSLAETQGIALIEAMYVKLPVVAFSVDAVSEIVIENETGFPVKLTNESTKNNTIMNMYNFDFNVDNNDIENLFNKIKEVLNKLNTTEQDRIIKNAYEMVLNKFEINITIKKLEDFYKGLIDEQKKSN